jgi:glycosyltransferase involved in cell wall biosynthesis
MLSIVIPLVNEAPSLGELHAEIAAALDRQRLDAEVIFVDDGSADNSWATITTLAARDARVRGIRLRRNFGKAAALSAGFHAARGDLVLTLDADLQDDPAEIPQFLAEIAKGFDVVSGWKRVRHDPWHKVLPSRVFNWLVGRLTGVKLHDHNCGMKAYRAIVLREVRLYGELHRFIPVLGAARGFRIGEIAINHRPRRYGHSKYGVGRFLKGFLDLLTVKFLTSYSHRPQHVLGSVGLLSFLLGGLGLTYLGVTWIVRLWRPNAFPPIHERPLLTYSLAALLLGAQLLSIGFLAELLIANRSQSAAAGDSDPGYSIAERTDGEAT